jgi:uncharacterized protein YndB with AHSA1/START domain
VTDTVDPDLAGIVRRARDRDVARADAALTGWPGPDPAQRAAIADHMAWMARSVASHGSTSAHRALLACWLEDDADDEAKALIRARLHTPASRLAAFAARRRYRREAYQRWYLPEHSALKRHLSCTVDVEVATPVDAVWRIVADPTRTPEWSHECCGVEFLDGATESGLGVKFVGANRTGRTSWSRTCTIFTFEAPHEFAYVTSGGQGDATAWHFRLEPTPTGTKLTQAYQIVAMPAWVSVMVGILMPSHDDRTDALRADLARIGALAEQHQGDQSPA